MAKYLISLLALLPLAALAQAQIVDPTRPPPGMGAGLSQPERSNEPATPAGPVLHSILFSPTRVVAIIDGNTVKVGDKVGEAKVVKITDNEVVLKNGKETQVLKLFDTVKKEMSPSRGGLRVESQRP